MQFYLSALCVGEMFVSGMDCESSWLGVKVQTCADDQHCCHEDGRYYCCSSAEFVFNRQVRGLTHTEFPS
jgi:hypothetical protein